MKVCIVGASGKLGQYMVKHLLDRGHEVVGVCRPRLRGQLKLVISREFPSSTHRLGINALSTDVVRRRSASRVPQMCPECVRVFSEQTTLKRRFAGTFMQALWRTRTADPLLTMEVRDSRYRPQPASFHGI